MARVDQSERTYCSRGDLDPKGALDATAALWAAVFSMCSGCRRPSRGRSSVHRAVEHPLVAEFVLSMGAGCAALAQAIDVDGSPKRPLGNLVYEKETRKRLKLG